MGVLLTKAGIMYYKCASIRGVANDHTFVERLLSQRNGEGRGS